MKSKIYLLAIVIAAIFSGCKEEPVAPTVMTMNITDSEYPDRAILYGDITDAGSSAITACGFYYNTSPDMSYPKVVPSECASHGGQFSAEITELEPGTTYYFRAYASNSAGTTEGETLSFRTRASAPIVETRPVSEVTTSGATLNAAIPNNGGSEIISCGFWYSTSEYMNDKLTAEFSGIPDSTFSVTLSGLNNFTTYYYKAFATNEMGTAEGEIMQFSTVIPPSVTTMAATSLGSASATLNGNVTNNGGTNNTIRGFLYGISEDNLADSITSGTGSGTYSQPITGLTPSTTYYFKAFASNNAGTVYGEVMQFSTITPTIPTVQTNAATSISTSSATLNGNVTATGSDPVTVRGFVYGTSESNLSSNVESGSGTGSYTKTITGLSHSTTYYYKAYATNAVGTSYGEVKQFTTVAINAPTVQTNAATGVTATGATLSGNVTGDGGATVTARGFVYGTSENSLTNNVQSGSGTGSYTKALTGLSHSTTYYYKAYATNAAGTSYGEIRQFATEAINAPTVQTNSAASVTATTASLSGNVTSDGGATVTSRGFMYGTSESNMSQTTQCGTGTGAFDARLTGLAHSTTYYYKAFATNSVGTSYGEVKTFSTTQITSGSVLTDSRDGNSYATVTIGNQTWMAENLRYAGNIQLGPSVVDDFLNGIGGETMYRYYPNGNSTNVGTYGYLYNWSAAVNGMYGSSSNPSGVQGICPSGWHLPSSAEWDQLASELGTDVGSQLAGNSSLWQSGALKNSPLFGATGFNALPAGYFWISYNESNQSYSFDYGYGQQAWFWTATSYNGNSSEYTGAYDKYIDYEYTGVYMKGFQDYEYSIYTDIGMSVRCVRNDQSKGTVRSKYSTPVKAFNKRLKR